MNKTGCNLILPVGTQVVSRINLQNPQGLSLCHVGAVGTIIEAPTDNSHAYRIQLPTGQKFSLKRHEFSIRKANQRLGLTQTADILTDYDLFECIIYRCIVGSRAYGLDDDFFI